MRSKAPAADAGVGRIVGLPITGDSEVAPAGGEQVRADARGQAIVREPAPDRVGESEPLDAGLADPPGTTEKPPGDDERAVQLPTRSDLSIPLMGDLNAEPLAEQFFSEGDLASRAGGEEDVTADDGLDGSREPVARKSLPEVVARRARLAKYVRAAVGGAAVVCLAAMVRTALAPATSGASTQQALATRAPTAPALASAPSETASVEKAARRAILVEPAPPPAASAGGARAEVEAEAPRIDVPALAPTDGPSAPDAGRAAAATASAASSALEEKVAARRALEHGRNADAVDAGRRSVDLDPTDGEAWLLLGAAYQEQGKSGDARRAYASCVKEGKRGPLEECRAMLR